MKKFRIIVIAIILILVFVFFYFGIHLKGIAKIKMYLGNTGLYEEECTLDIPKITSQTDCNNNGIPDSEDILIGARKDVANKPAYVSKYYENGYPPDNEGVCTDVIWRAMKEAGYNLKNIVDEDIKNNVNLYPRVQGKPDPNIDFRRVDNLEVFFERHYQKLTNELIPNDIENLSQWQGGDIVIFNNHIGIVSDKRNKEGIPYIIHNAAPYTKEVNQLGYWNFNISPVIGHYRISE